VAYHGPDPDYQGRHICLNSSETALGIVDVTDKAAPKIIAKAAYPNVAYAHQGWLTDDHRYFYLDDEGDESSGTVPGTRTLIWDLSDLDEPVVAGEYIASTRSTDHNQYVIGNLLYQSNYRSGLRILDITQRTRPIEVGFFDTVPGTDSPEMTGSWNNYPFFKSGTIVVNSMQEGMFLVKQSDRRLVP
jgi:choice-of-anchor B domain-containing protein